MPAQVPEPRRLACLLLVALTIAFFTIPAAGMSASFDEGLQQLSDAILVEIPKAESKPTVVVLEFTDVQGKGSAAGRFLAEELAAELVASGEVQVMDRHHFAQYLKDHGIDSLQTVDRFTLRQLGTDANVQHVVVGSFIDTGSALRVTAKVLAPQTAKMVTASQVSLPKTGPIVELLKAEAPAAPTVAVPEKPEKHEKVQEPPSVSNELYRMTVRAASHAASELVMELLIENLSSRALRVSCVLRETYVMDQAGTRWPQDIEQNREGLCVRGLALPPDAKQRARLTFSTPDLPSRHALAIRLYVD